MATNEANPVRLGMQFLLSIFAIAWLPQALTGTNVLEIIGGAEGAVMLATVLALTGAYNLAELTGANDKLGGS